MNEELSRAFGNRDRKIGPVSYNLPDSRTVPILLWGSLSNPDIAEICDEESPGASVSPDFEMNGMYPGNRQ